MCDREKEEFKEMLNILSDPDKFREMSDKEQDDFVERFIDTSIKLEENDVSGMPKVFVQENKGRNKNNMFSFKDTLKSLGKDKLKESLKEAVKDGVFKCVKIPIDKLIGLKDKIVNGKDFDDEEKALLEMMGIKFDEDQKTRDSKDFTAYAICTIISDMLFTDFLEDTLELKDKPQLSLDYDCIANVAYLYAIASSLIDKKSTIRKIYDKYGLKKLKERISNVTMDLEEIFIDYFQKNDVSPEMAIISILEMVKIVSAHTKIGLKELDDDKDPTKYISALFHSIFYDNDTEDQKILKNYLDGNKEYSSEDSDKKSPNGENKEIKKNIREILLDD